MKGMQIAESIFGHQRTAIQPHPANHLRGPNRIAGKQRIKLRRAQKTDHADLHNEVVDQLLRLLLRQLTGTQIAFNINIQKRRGAPQRHCAAVLGFHRRQIGKIEPLYRFLRITGRAGNIAAVLRGHLLNLQQRAAMLRQLFALAQGRFEIVSPLQL